MPVMIALPLFVNSSLIASQNEEFKRYETFHTPAASRRTISRAARSCSSADKVPSFFGARRRLGASLLIKSNFLNELKKRLLPNRGTNSRDPAGPRRGRSQRPCG